MKQINVSLTDEMHKEVAKAAEQKRMSMVDWTRNVIADQFVKPQIVKLQKDSEVIEAEAMIFRPKMINDAYWFGAIKINQANWKMNLSSDSLPWNIKLIFSDGQDGPISVFSYFSSSEDIILMFMGADGLDQDWDKVLKQEFGRWYPADATK